jgi:histidine triad (HIT) family protein
MAGCLFCKIVAGEIPSTKVAENDRCLAFRDIGPQAPTHVLVIPKEHFTSMNDVKDGALLADLMSMAREVAASEGAGEKGYRLVINTGPDGGQMVHHLHVHVLAGRRMTWPPG